ncbi:hypothetical protein PCC7424_2434 [Gloeothece citriformis PCC 7424]|uniref:Uncharacterized protein n=1 Tax=Gloeothece citriformis (strain PCC 7424) TaxID=65393 RepID=B7KJ18_GLOC7|nr:hypothetical protein [Gloeothece citriformis]ACK70854.1 hypothetical protein PCC7424_2434 [Gloeothece citriformis PCC 7424]
MISLLQTEIFPVEKSSHPLVIEFIPLNERVLPQWEYRLIHHESGLQIPGHFTQTEAQLICQVTRQWDWTVDKNHKPACAAQLLQLLEQVCATPCKSKEKQI